MAGVELTIRPGAYNILRFRNGPINLFAAGTLPNGHVEKIRPTRERKLDG